MAGGTTYWETARTVRDGSKRIRITLVYTDDPSAVGTTYAVRNNLNLTAFQGPGCLPCWYGTNINPTTGDSYNSYQSQTRDSLNNVEEIIIPGGYYATGSTVKISVTGYNLVADAINPDNPGAPFQQDFAIFVDNLY